MREIILILTNKADTHPTSVINLMREMNIPFFRLNTESLLTDYHFTWYCDNGFEDLVVKNIHNNQEIHGQQIKSVWCRRPEAPSELRWVTKFKDYNLKEADRFLWWLMSYLSNIYSIGSIRNNKYASSKLVQLSLAARLGMIIPRTCMTNTKESIIEFASNETDLLLKPFGADGFEADGLYYLTYATKTNSKDIFSQPEEAFSQTVNFCENYVPKDFEVRATVMGPHIFACKLDSQNQKEDEGKIDWRQGYDFGLKHEMITMPEGVNTFCRQYLREMGLNFGCFDFIVRPDGQYVFLECNPNGQWGWIEDELGISSMSEAMVDCLVNCKTV